MMWIKTGRAPLSKPIPIFYEDAMLGFDVEDVMLSFASNHYPTSRVMSLFQPNLNDRDLTRNKSQVRILSLHCTEVGKNYV